jgi:hypothetical protein
VLIKIPKRKNITFYQLIEDQFHLVAKVKYRSFSKYILFSKAALMLGYKPAKLMHELIVSKTLHGVKIIETNEIYVHPDDLLRRARIHGKRMCLNIAAKFKRISCITEVIDVT